MATTSKGIYYPNDYTKVADVPADMKALAKSVDTVIDDINNDINLANRNLANVIQLAMTNQKNIDTEHETNTQQDKDIEALQTENEELKAENERLRQDMNAYPSNTVEGEYITLTDSADSRFNKFKVIGKSTQKTRSGKNMIHIIRATETNNGITFTNNEDGSVTINGTATANAYFNINNVDTDNRKYFTLIKDENYGLYLGNSAEGLSMICRSSTKNYALLTLPENQNERVQQYTAETDNQCWAYLTVESGVTINNLTVYPMIVKGTEIGEWELYGALPRPNEESPIQNVEGNVNIAITNSNLFGKGFATPKTDTNFWYTVGEGFTPLEDGWGRLELDNTGSSSAGYMNAWSRMSNFLNVIKPSTKYKIIVEWRNLEIGTNISSNYLCICGNNNQEAFKGSFMLYYSTLTTTNKSSIEIITKDNIKPLSFLLRTFISVRPGEKLSIEFRVSIQAENSNADYEDGKYQQFIFPLEEEQKLMEGDYLADDGIHHIRNTVVLKGTEDWKYDSNYKRWHIAALALYDSVVGAGKANLQCNYFKYSNSVDDLNKISDDSSSEWYFYIEDKYLNEKTFPEWIKEKDAEGKPLIVEYDILEEKQSKYVELYTPEQQKVYDEIVNTAKTYKTVTNIFSTNEISPKFEVEYRQDIKSLINNVSQAVLNNA